MEEENELIVWVRIVGGWTREGRSEGRGAVELFWTACALVLERGEDATTVYSHLAVLSLLPFALQEEEDGNMEVG